MSSGHLDGSFNGYNPCDSYIRVSYSYSHDINNNSSSLSVSLEAHCFNSASYSSNPGAYYVLNVNGVNKTGYYPFNGSFEAEITSYSTTIGHNDNGDAAFYVSAYFEGAGSGTGLGGASISTQWISLGNIPRASRISSCGNVTLSNSSTCNIVWSPKSSSFKYKLEFSIGNWSVNTSYIQPNSTAQYTYTGTLIPLNGIAQELPNSTDGVVSVKLRTYNSSGTQIGSSSSSSFIVYIPSSVKPVVGVNILQSDFTIQHSPGSNAVVNGWCANDDGLYVQTFSKAKISVSQTSDNGLYGAEIAGIQISGAESIFVSGKYITSYITGVLQTSGVISFGITVYDTRGRMSDTIIKSITVKKYYPPSVTGTINRKSSDTNNGLVSASWNFAQIQSVQNPNNYYNSVNCLFKYKPKAGSAYTTYSISTQGVNNELVDAFDVSTSYDCIFIITDATGNYSQFVTDLGTTFATLDFRGGGNNIAIGKMAEGIAASHFPTASGVLEVDWDSQFNNDVYIDGDAEIGGNTTIGGTLSLKDANNILHTIPDIIYPVGSIYMSINSTSPASLFGGTWERLKNYFLYGGVDDTDGYSEWYYVCGENSTFTVIDTAVQYKFGAGEYYTDPITFSETGVKTADLETFGGTDPYCGHSKYVYCRRRILVGSAGGFDRVNQASFVTPINSGSFQYGGDNYVSAVRSRIRNYVEQTGGVDVDHSAQVQGKGGSIVASGTADTEVGMITYKTDNMPPYLAVYMWKRVS